MHLRWWQAVAAVLLGATALAHRADAQRATRGITPVPFNDNSPVNLTISLDPKEARIGSTVSICFQASKAGFTTLWDIATDGKVARVFPNQFTHTGAAAPVEAGRQYCAGGAGDPFRFRVDAPAGIEDLYVLWTTKPELQPAAASYADAQALVLDLQRLGGANTADWGSQKLTFDIVPADGPHAPPLPPQQTSGNVTPPTPAPAPAPAPAPVPVPVPAPPSDQTASNVPTPTPPPAPAPSPGPQTTAANDTLPADAPKVYVLAMGANVAGLTKSNQDAHYFTKAVAKVFSVPNDNIRVVDNGKQTDFIAGMQWLRTAAKPQDVVFIYFSGHGGRFRDDTSDDGWDEYLVPYDFEAAHPDPKNLLFSQVISILINRLPTKNVIAVIDACHSAGVFRSMQASVLGARSKYYALPPEMIDAARDAAQHAVPQTRAAGGRNRVAANGLLLAAAHRDKNALEGPDGSFFTLAIVQEMMSKSGGTLMDVFGRTVTTTKKLTDNRQEPEAVGDSALGRSISFE